MLSAALKMAVKVNEVKLLEEPKSRRIFNAYLNKGKSFVSCLILFLISLINLTVLAKVSLYTKDLNVGHNYQFSR